MDEQSVASLDLSRNFPHLAAAPIVEAVIHWSARAEREWQRDQLKAELVNRLPSYPNQKAQHEIRLAMEAQFGQEAAAPQATSIEGWVGFRCSTPDELNVAQFKRDGFVFSRLRPYQDWETFESEARRLWRVFVELAEPSEVSRLGVRFINRIPIAANTKLSDYLLEPPTLPLGLPLTGFLYQSRFSVPGEHLGVNIVKTLQSEESLATAENALILDTDVFTRRPLICGEGAMDEVLPKMRWLKNAIFFDLLKPDAIDSFKGT